MHTSYFKLFFIFFVFILDSWNVFQVQRSCTKSKFIEIWEWKQQCYGLSWSFSPFSDVNFQNNHVLSTCWFTVWNLAWILFAYETPVVVVMQLKLNRKLKQQVCFFFFFLQGRVWLIDLNPFGEVTDSLLFSWDELMSGEVVDHQQQVSKPSFYPKRPAFATRHGSLRDGWFVWQDGPAFRYTTSEVTVQPSPCLSYRIPRDFVDLSAGEDAYKLIDFLKLVGSGVCTLENATDKNLKAVSKLAKKLLVHQWAGADAKVLIR